jgi:hypothetical protein
MRNDDSPLPSSINKPAQYEFLLARDQYDVKSRNKYIFNQNTFHMSRLPFTRRRKH